MGPVGAPILLISTEKRGDKTVETNRKLLKNDGIALAIFSMIYGAVLIIFPEIIKTYPIYELVRRFVISPYTIGIILILLGIIKIVGLVTNIFVLKRIGLVGLLVVYSVLGISFILSTPANTMSLMMLYIAYTVFSISLKEGNL